MFGEASAIAYGHLPGDDNIFIAGAAEFNERKNKDDNQQWGLAIY